MIQAGWDFFQDPARRENGELHLLRQLPRYFKESTCGLLVCCFSVSLALLVR